MWRNKIAAIAKNYPDITFAIASDDEMAKMMEDFGLHESGEDMNIGLWGANNKKYGMEPMEEFDTEQITEFLDNYKKGDSSLLFLDKMYIITNPMAYLLGTMQNINSPLLIFRPLTRWHV